MTIVDTCVWSLVFRRRVLLPSNELHELQRLITLQSAWMIGNVRQELLSGIPDPVRFVRVRQDLRGFPNLHLKRADYERAAEFDRLCRAAGVTGSSTDMLICSSAERYRMAIFSTDPDFTHYARVLPITLHPIPQAPPP